MHWICANSIPGAGVAVSSRNRRPYPEVSGYLIPTLLQWGERELANIYGQWLLACQQTEGCWGDPDENLPHVFDTGQVIRGMLALKRISKSEIWNDPIRRACDWICSCISDTGEPLAPDTRRWNIEIPHSVLLYSYAAVSAAGYSEGVDRWVSTMDRAVAWFLRQPGLTDFAQLSHYHAYILEALYDLGSHEIVREAMQSVQSLQRSSGWIPAHRGVRWTCSTGLFQYAVIWYKLGELKKADKTFGYAVSLQNKSGGWFGSYGRSARYFQDAEISWAAKYFLDALSLRIQRSFEAQSDTILERIDDDDGRYVFIKETIAQSGAKSVLDAGCGKGRFVKNLLRDLPAVHLSAMDFSASLTSCLPRAVSSKQGSILSIPYDDAKFDYVYAVEALEHVVNIPAALRELARVLKSGGTLVIIDKNKKHLGRFALPDWEQWFDTHDLCQSLKALGFNVTFKEGVAYENRADRLFTAWLATKN
jgi:malonyl-CoA O-methyltransferase